MYILRTVQMDVGSGAWNSAAKHSHQEGGLHSDSPLPVVLAVHMSLFPWTDLGGPAKTHTAQFVPGSLS